jgi:hypothetical protein
VFQKGVKNSSFVSLNLFLLLPTSGWSTNTWFRHAEPAEPLIRAFSMFDHFGNHRDPEPEKAH